MFVHIERGGERGGSLLAFDYIDVKEQRAESQSCKSKYMRTAFTHMCCRENTKGTEKKGTNTERNLGRWIERKRRNTINDNRRRV